MASPHLSDGRQSTATSGTEHVLIMALMIITVISIGALLWIVLASGSERAAPPH